MLVASRASTGQPVKHTVMDVAELDTKLVTPLNQEQGKVSGLAYGNAFDMG